MGEPGFRRWWTNWRIRVHVERVNLADSKVRTAIQVALAARYQYELATSKEVLGSRVVWSEATDDMDAELLALLNGKLLARAAPNGRSTRRMPNGRPSAHRAVERAPFERVTERTGGQESSGESSVTALAKRTSTLVATSGKSGRGYTWWKARVERGNEPDTKEIKRHMGGVSDSRARAYRSLWHKQLAADRASA
jgi:hypothetical protein